MKVINTLKNAFGKSLCNICLKECRIKHLDHLHICSACYEKVRSLQNDKQFKLSREQFAGGIKDEL